MIEITPSLSLDDSEIQFDFIRASGPGGQNVNKIASVAQLRFDIRSTSSLDAEVKERLIKLAGSRVTENGILILEAKRFRTQEQNRADAIARLVSLIQKALEKPRLRRATRPSRASQAARVESKKKRGEIKRSRHSPPEEWR
ncbi:MAG TPA: alternative ribosome rescue aminoacyl-tRNA hydrolase ArfB [Anaerolineaceae bacterium]|nr:alternative ribosome rescue aminoacyl-tRNA hydrolase ArfB [Anaerolineaceae bacterium]